MAHPGAQLNLFEEANGWRYRCCVTNTALGQPADWKPANWPWKTEILAAFHTLA